MGAVVDIIVSYSALRGSHADVDPIGVVRNDIITYVSQTLRVNSMRVARNDVIAYIVYFMSVYRNSLFVMCNNIISYVILSEPLKSIPDPLLGEKVLLHILLLLQYSPRQNPQLLYVTVLLRIMFLELPEQNAYAVVIRDVIIAYAVAVRTFEGNSIVVV